MLSSHMDFNKALSTHDSDFESILEIMKLRRVPEEVDAVRNLLLTVNLIIDYFINREDDELRVPVVYFPICKPYSQELCEDFVCLKLGCYSSEEWKSFLYSKLKKDSLYIPSDVKTRKQHLLLRENHKFEQDFCSIIKKSIKDYSSKCRGITLLYSDNIKKCFDEYNEARRSWNRKTVNKYWYLSNTVSGLKDSSSSSCPLKLVASDADDFYNTFMDNENTVRIENLVVFPSKTADGRYSKFCADILQKPYFDDFVDAGTGLRNVFFFSFSRKPYRLRRLLDFKQRMKERVQINDDTFEFISFTYEESLLLNGEGKQNQHMLMLGKDMDELQMDYEALLDDMTLGLDRYVFRRNEMALCISDESISYYEDKLAEETEADKDSIGEIFDINRKLWSESIDSFLRHFVYNEDVFVVFGYGIALELQYMFKDVLINQYQARNVSFGTFGHLRGYQINGEYVNEIQQQKILVLSFRNDYTESIFHKYPNSFDPFCINKGQKLVEISNYFLLRSYYDWGKYNYGKAIRRILKSEFRDLKMKPILIEYKRPTKKLPEDTREEELDRNANRSVPQICITTIDNVNHSYGKSEWMLYEYNGSQGIAPLSDLCDIYESYENLRIQPIAPLVKLIVKKHIEAERDKDTKSERLFKEQPSYGLSQEEINSNIQLWKILLAKRVKQKSERVVYDEIMSHFNERYIISFHSFKRWLDPDYGIPRARKMQKYLIEDYLGIRPPYINVIRRIKERTKSDTESVTISIRHFLNLTLLSSDYVKVYSALSEETKDLLGISDAQDIAQILSDVKQKIKFESIKKIEL